MTFSRIALLSLYRTVCFAELGRGASFELPDVCIHMHHRDQATESYHIANETYIPMFASAAVELLHGRNS